ncbi:uncharacterized protein Z518_03452 [Rhinocladiella mackenziei CBS 650.93]|uniref:beta-glucosidase n=1 Tax=Rhinocladiella mackenziei CBS 650.93 TaxID=1442369 RepID=A0A0D2JHG5_9EURO|nr:uncharacterized protein Z518_03452 [Rhinocladiella mackenziei CBS 650.93]KIX08795.1 hypothetical protein Z518_03452 [Rhinocladiella mackenziei CBS 650.93]
MGVLGNDATDLNGFWARLDSVVQSRDNCAWHCQTLQSINFIYDEPLKGYGTLTNNFSLEAIIKARAAQDGTLVQCILDNTLITSTGSPTSSNSPGRLSFIIPVPEEYLRRLEAGWNSSAVVNAVAAYCNNTILITQLAGLDVMPGANNPNVTAILAAHLPGQEAGNPIIDILYSTVNPCGKLPYTIALNRTDYGFGSITNSSALLETEDSNMRQSNFNEGLLIDYRHSDYINQPVAFELGFRYHITPSK